MSTAGASLPRRRRVALVITMLELGGAQRLVLHIARTLDKTRFDVLLVAGPGGLLDDEARALPGVRFETCPWLVREVRPVHDARAIVDLWARLRAFAPDVVHTHSSKAGIVGRLAAALAGVPRIVHTVHGWGFNPNQSPARQRAFVLAEKLAGSVTTQWIAVSEANARAGAARGIAPRSAFTIVRPGIFSRRFAQASGNGRFRAELGLGPDDPLVGMVACLKPQKTPVDFVRVAARVADAVPNARFVLVGDGELRPDVEAAVREAGLDGRFTLLGWRHDPESIVGDLDVLALTSRHEGLPMVVPEAMAAGKPVVATAVDGTPEAVQDGVTGYLAAHGDVAALAAAITRLLQDRDRRARMGQAARAASAGWDIDAMAERHAALYAAD